MFDLSILDLDPSKIGHNRSYWLEDGAFWYVVDDDPYLRRTVPIRDPDKLALLNNLKKAGITFIEVSHRAYFYKYNINFYSDNFNVDLTFWDESGDQYDMWVGMIGNHDLSYSSDKPKLTGLRVH